MRRKRWDKAKVISSIKKLKSKQDKYVRHSDAALYKAGIRYFGSWRDAVISAGFNYDEIKAQHYTKDIIISKILCLNKFNCNYNRYNNSEIYNAAVHHFGSWGKAVVAAGIDYKSKTQKWTKNKIIGAIKDLKYKNVYYVERTNMPLMSMAIHYFGSWRAAIESAGYNYENIVAQFHGEKELLSVLIDIFGENEIIVKKRFDWLKMDARMHVDFYIEKYKLAIERQGRQHFTPVDFAGRGKEWAHNEFKKICKRDKKKKNLLKRHGVKLIEVRYDEPHSFDFIINKIKSKRIL